VFKLREKVLGSEHPDTLNSRNNLAHVFYSQGKVAEAIAELQEVQKDCEAAMEGYQLIANANKKMIELLKEDQKLREEKK